MRTVRALKFSKNVGKASPRCPLLLPLVASTKVLHRSGLSGYIWVRGHIRSDRRRLLSLIGLMKLPRDRHVGLWGYTEHLRFPATLGRRVAAK